MFVNQWNSTLYDRQHAFVWQYGASLLEWLAPQPGEQILDLGCGTGHLTAQIAATGAIAAGMDADPMMIATAQQTYPQINFAIADARNFQVPTPLDAIFSNAALHWIQEPDLVIQCINRSLKPGGRFVAELGGQGNIAMIATALFGALRQLGDEDCDRGYPWYFPSVSDYATRLEQHGLEVRQIVLFDRPTPLADGAAGLSHWLHMFANGILAHLSADERQHVIQQVETALKSVLYRDGTWIADYRRLRVLAWKS
ncbi:MAG: methyltransferase domain-containing protein [Leptolyngbyaceae cyanobacterium bins.349]|nr:methyltransferase domain-containing protein [Leptolyngbyaceae cyanobacterium bins.349]